MGSPARPYVRVMILVTGATGNAGGAVARALLAAGRPVRALIRADADAARLPAGTEVFVRDLNRPETLAPGLRGVKAVFLLSGYDGLRDTLDLMRTSGVERVVLLSSSAVPGGDMGNAIARYHIVAEQAVRSSGLPWTFLQPNSFMSNTLRWAAQLGAGDVVRAPFGGVAVAAIDPHDVGAVAAAALTSPEHEGRTYRLSGPESLLPSELVEILGHVLGRTLRFEEQSDVEAWAELEAAMPIEYVNAIFSFFGDGDLDESRVLPAVEEITGRRPRSFEAWARAHADAFVIPDFADSLSRAAA